MPPRKGTKGPSNEIYYEDQRLSDEIVILTLRLAALKKVYVDRMEEAVGKQQLQLKLSDELAVSEEQLAQKKEERTDVLMNYVREYKTDERETILKITALHNSVHALQEEKVKLQKQIQECDTEYDKKIREKRQELNDISQRMSEMEKEFTAMLSDIEQSVQAPDDV